MFAKKRKMESFEYKHDIYLQVFRIQCSQRDYLQKYSALENRKRKSPSAVFFATVVSIRMSVKGRKKQAYTYVLLQYGLLMSH